MKNTFVIFGATGDLTARYLIPALSELYDAERLPPDFSIIGVAMEDWDSAKFRRHIEERNVTISAELPLPATLRESLEYRRADVSRPEEVVDIAAGVREAAVFYLALPPGLFAPVVEALARTQLPPGSAILFEKPFGTDLSSARSLNRFIRERFPEEMIFRIDSFLGEQTVHNILGLRFANRILEPLWSAEHVALVEIVWDETLTLEGRSSYYDRAGALKDMIQNHLLQLLCLIAMEPPRTFSERDFRDRKVEVLQAVRRLSVEEVVQGTVRGRYAAGRIGKRRVPAYVDEEGVNPARETETFAQVCLYVDNGRWNGVPFILRTGKALAEDRMEITIRFKSREEGVSPVEGKDVAANVLRLELNPDRIALGVNISGSCDGCAPRYVELKKELAEQDLSAYARLLLQVLDGRQNLFIRADEAEESWEIVDPILQEWSKGSVPLREYAAGTAGPIGED